MDPRPALARSDDNTGDDVTERHSKPAWEMDNEGPDFITPDFEPDLRGDLHTRHMKINMGPSHPAMHGTVQLQVELDGETIVHSECNIGYLHRGFEKMAESVTWTKVFPYTDRLNYVSPLLNNIGYAMAVEKLLGITDEIPERSQYLRVILGEVSRITDHQTATAAMLMELGAMTAYFYLIEGREALWDLIEAMVGGRVTTSWARIGGSSQDIPDEDWIRELRKVLIRCEGILQETDGLVKANRIFIDRTKGVGAMSPTEAINRGWTGPVLRSTGVPYDIRKTSPYLVYDRMDFDVPVGTNGDVYDRYLVRMEEMRQSARIINQALDQLPKGPINIDRPEIFLPEKKNVHYSIEGLINHFKVMMDGVKVPPGEIYSYTEAANGELGFYLVSTGEGKPWKCRVRPPSFFLVQSLPRMVQGRLVADIVPCFGSINMIGGECDR